MNLVVCNAFLTGREQNNAELYALDATFFVGFVVNAFLATELTSSALCQYGELTIRCWPGHKFREAYGQDTNVQQNAKC